MRSLIAQWVSQYRYDLIGGCVYVIALEAFADLTLEPYVLVVMAAALWRNLPRGRSTPRREVRDTGPARV